MRPTKPNDYTKRVTTVVQTAAVQRAAYDAVLVLAEAMRDAKSAKQRLELAEKVLRGSRDFESAREAVRECRMNPLPTRNNPHPRGSEPAPAARRNGRPTPVDDDRKNEAKGIPYSADPSPHPRPEGGAEDQTAKSQEVCHTGSPEGAPTEGSGEGTLSEESPETLAEAGLRDQEPK